MGKSFKQIVEESPLATIVITAIAAGGLVWTVQQNTVIAGAKEKLEEFRATASTNASHIEQLNAELRAKSDGLQTVKDQSATDRQRDERSSQEKLDACKTAYGREMDELKGKASPGTSTCTALKCG